MSQLYRRNFPEGLSAADLVNGCLGSEEPLVCGTLATILRVPDVNDCCLDNTPEDQR